MRIAKVPMREVAERVWASLDARKDPQTQRVRPSWCTLMREAGVCRQRISDAITLLCAEGRIKRVTVPCNKPDGSKVEVLYELHAEVMRDWASHSV